MVGNYSVLTATWIYKFTYRYSYRTGSSRVQTDRQTNIHRRADKDICRLIDG